MYLEKRGMVLRAFSHFKSDVGGGEIKESIRDFPIPSRQELNWTCSRADAAQPVTPWKHVSPQNGPPLRTFRILNAPGAICFIPDAGRFVSFLNDVRENDCTWITPWLPLKLRQAVTSHEGFN